MSSGGNLQLHYNDTVMGFGPQLQDCRSSGFLFFLFSFPEQILKIAQLSMVVWELCVLLGEVSLPASN